MNQKSYSLAECCVGGSSITVVLLETGHGGVILVTGLGLESCEHKAFFVLVDMLSLAVEKKNPLFVYCALSSAHMDTVFIRC